MVQNNLEENDVLNRAHELDFPSSVIEFMQGHLGQPYGGYPEPLRTKVSFLFFTLLYSFIICMCNLY